MDGTGRRVRRHAPTGRLPSLTFAPRLPAALTRLGFGVHFAGRRLRIDITPQAASYRLLSGDPLPLLHHGRQVTASVGEVAPHWIPALVAAVAPTQPAGRAPARRVTGLTSAGHQPE